MELDIQKPPYAGSQLLASSVVGDGGVSWRLKALKRAKEARSKLLVKEQNSRM